MPELQGWPRICSICRAAPESCLLRSSLKIYNYFEKEDLEDEGKNDIPSFPQNAHLDKKDMGKYFKIQMKIFQLQRFRFRNEMLCFSGTLLASSSCKATVRKTWRNEEEVKILHEKASKPHQCKVKEQTCATNAKKLRTSKSCLQHISQAKTKKKNIIQLLTLHLH